MGDFYNEIHSLKAEEYYRKALKPRLNLTEIEPKSMLWKRYLGFIYKDLANFYATKDNLVKIKEFYEKNLNISLKLFKSDLNNTL